MIRAFDLRQAAIDTRRAQTKQFSEVLPQGVIPGDVQLPIDFSKSDKANEKATVAARTDAINYRLGNSISAGPVSLGVNTLIGEEDKRKVPGSRNTPTKEVVDTLRLTDIPVEDIHRSSAVIQSVNKNAWFGHGNTMSEGEYGSHDPRTGVISYDADLSGVGERRDVLTHELAHHLQSVGTDPEEFARTLHKHNRWAIRDTSQIMVDSVEAAIAKANEVEEDPYRRKNVINKINSRVDAARRVLGTVVPRFNLNQSSEQIQLESMPVVSSTTARALAEGSAVGYQGRYSGSGRMAEYGYAGGEVFGPRKNAYLRAQAFTHGTGMVVPDSAIDSWAQLAGVLQSDLVDGKRSAEVDDATLERIATHMMRTPRSREFRRNRAVGREIEQRSKALNPELDYGQMSLFPDLNPDRDAFGGEAGMPELSPRGTALAEGRPTEIPVSQTSDILAIAQRKIGDTRRSDRVWRDSGDQPRNVRLWTKLQKHVGEVQTRRATEAAAAETRSNLTSTGEVHPDVQAWLGKLVHTQKRQHAEDYYHWVMGGRQGDMPALPRGLKEEHAEKGRASVDKILGKLNLG